MNRRIHPAHLPRQYMDSHDVAAIFLRAREWFYANRADLEDKFGFPKPIEALSSANFLLWDPLDVVAWQNLQLTPAAREALAELLARAEDRAEDNGAAVTLSLDDAATTAALKLRAEALAGGG